MDHVELLEKIRAGEPNAFDELVGMYGDGIYGFGMRMCGEREDAKDVLQDTLLQAYRSLKDLKHPEALKSWLYRVAANACLMKRRRGKFEPKQELSLDDLKPDRDDVGRTEIPDAGALPDEELSREEVRGRVRDAIGELPAHYRIVLVLRDMEHFSTAEVSRMLELPVSTVKMRLHRARLMLRERLETEFAQEGSGPEVEA